MIQPDCIHCPWPNSGHSDASCCVERIDMSLSLSIYPCVGMYCVYIYICIYMRACVCVCVHVCGHNYMSHTYIYIYILIVTYIYVHAYVCTCISFSLNPKIKVWADASKRSSQHLKIIEGHSVGEGQKTRNRVHVLILV